VTSFLFLWFINGLSYISLSSPCAAKEQLVIKLPQPAYDGNVSVEKALQKRKSVRSYTNGPVSLSEVSQLLWAAQGITRKNGMRTSPSAGALYPLEVYLVAGHVQKLPQGIYKYRPLGHELVMIEKGDQRADLCAAALAQTCIEDGAIDIVLTAVYERTARKYGKKAERYVHMEIGHAAQNIYLQAVALGLGTVVVGAFNEASVKEVLMMKREQFPLCIMPIGRVD
jgi:SagB-type dehydrogenase family enzyme